MEPPVRHVLEHLADVELENQQGRRRVFPGKGRIGEHLASGEGAVFGPVLNGIVNWDLLQEEGEHHSGFNILGQIETDDRGKILFNALGYTTRENGENVARWSLTGSVIFNTEDRQYLWLNNIVGVLQGLYDMGSFRHSYRIYMQRSMG
jgi:hypothetical protein